MSEEEKTKLRADSIGIIFQQFHLLPHMTALENVMLVLEILGKSLDESKSIACSMLDNVGLGHRHSHYPAQLSGGEKQRVAMARAMVTKPKLILADEPSGSLDQDTGDDIMSLIFELVEQNNTGLILVTHNNDLAKKCERVLNLSRGTFSSPGP
jgi:putative ABC transport system ATP-binding protein